MAGVKSMGGAEVESMGVTEVAFIPFSAHTASLSTMEQRKMENDVLAKEMAR